MNPLQAIQAYSAAAGNASPVAGSAQTAAPGFAEMLSSAMGETTQATRAAETQMAAHTQGRGELIDVVTAISSAEASLETVMAVRDQVIQAYQEIMRMPI